MKKIFRKVVAAAMALTLLGTGTAFTKAVSYDTNAVTASAASIDPRSPHSHGQFIEEGDLEISKWVERKQRTGENVVIFHIKVYRVWNCRACGGTVKRELIYSDTKECSSLDTSSHIWDWAHDLLKKLFS